MVLKLCRPRAPSYENYLRGRSRCQGYSLAFGYILACKLLTTWKIMLKVNYEPRGNLDDWNLGLSWSKIALDLNPHSLLRKLRGI